MNRAETASLTELAIAVLQTADAIGKARASQAAAQRWRCEALPVGRSAPPIRPARPAHPKLMLPRDMPKRGAAQTEAGRIALLHALAHIELNAVDLAWDIVARFATVELPRGFFDDWVSVADEEAKHFLLLSDRLADFGARYGDLPAHDGLWQAAEATAHDLLARLAIVPLVLEARGLDVTPTMIERMTRFGDARTEAVLQTIYHDEIGHVAIGSRWFHYLCERQGVAPRQTWRTLVERHFKGALKPPFNDIARTRAGLPRAYYAAGA
ncbi:MAG: ferritin-like domain-containing protein [Alphaproteobacteria bacterium]